ncbi:prohibitin family protein [Seonamhaeicola maritimus]|uniref:prohibitin family protein n=1 Tax=Seonamhaeicola maritimus TaxID=2591822 RepID=UPI0024959C84|nr:prohibitin family protein [Seonamhaeicola maritimus]
MEKLPKIAFPFIVVGIILIIVLAKSAVTIDAGHAAVLYETLKNGVDPEKDALGPGFHIIAPWNRVIDYETRQQEVPEAMSVLSSNGLDIKLDASVLYEPDVSNLGKLHNQKGENYLRRVLQPAVRSAARSVVGRYTPEQLYSSKRDAIQEEIFLETKNIVQSQFIQLNSILIRDVTLPPTIKEAIERKLKQEQESLEYEFRLVTAAKEAEKVIIEAQGKADANRILSASLTDKILQDKGIEATIKLSESPNSKVIVIGSGDSGMPLILGNN